jgi:hypothetical protein
MTSSSIGLADAVPSQSGHDRNRLSVMALWKHNRFG